MSRVRVFAAGMAVAVLAVLSAAAPASAHDELLASSPASGERLDAAPASVSLQFSAEVMTMGAVVVIADADGADWAESEPVITDSMLTVDVLPDMPVGGYELRWRVVSSDGHPIAGIIPFTVGDAQPLVRKATAEAASDDDAGGQGAESQITQGNSTLRLVLIGAGGAVAAIAVFALVRFLLRRRGGPADIGDSDAARRDAVDL